VIAQRTDTAAFWCAFVGFGIIFAIIGGTIVGLGVKYSDMVHSFFRHRGGEEIVPLNPASNPDPEVAFAKNARVIVASIDRYAR
jgi:hypothetical protein